MDKHNSYWITGGPWYNTFICKNYMENCLKNLLEMQELTDIISFVVLMNMIKGIHQNMMMREVVVAIQYHLIKQQKNYFQSVPI